MGGGQWVHLLYYWSVHENLRFSVRDIRVVGCRWDIGYSSRRHSDRSADLQPLPPGVAIHAYFHAGGGYSCHATIFMIKQTGKTVP